MFNLICLALLAMEAYFLSKKNVAWTLFPATLIFVIFTGEIFFTEFPLVAKGSYEGICRGISLIIKMCVANAAGIGCIATADEIKNIKAQNIAKYLALIAAIVLNISYLFICFSTVDDSRW